MFNIVKRTFEFAGQTVVLETGRIARQATSSVYATMGDCAVLVAVVASKQADSSKDFFPLTVNYQEKVYAAGRIPGGYLKREGRPSEKETLTSRLIDRPIRPLFPKGFKNEVQISITVVATDKKFDPDIVSMLATSAALAASGLPFNGPIAGARVGMIDGEYLINPGYDVLKKSDLDLVVAGTEGAVLMVESEANELTEDQMLGAVLFGHEACKSAIAEIRAFAAEVNRPSWNWEPEVANTSVKAWVEERFTSAISAAYAVTDKASRYSRLNQIRFEMNTVFQSDESLKDQPEFTEKSLTDAFASVEKRVVRQNILSGKPRIDGRDHRSIRPIDVQVGVLPKVHGSALFTRGETQALVVTTLGGGKDGQIIDALEGSRTDAFMLHYNFPPYCVGEVGYSGGPKRREIGHGRLARRALESVLPNPEEFPYIIRLVSEITESNGSSSMASVCGGSLSLMDAGVPLRAPVAGIAMGLVKEENRFAILSDILGDEDHLGDMDFKVAGTAEGVTALQMDIKIEGITEEIMERALNQAREGRLHILRQMENGLTKSREAVNENAPCYATFKINPDKIRDVIGKGGATIRSICEQTSATIDIEEDGRVKVYGQDREATEAAMKRIEEVVAVPEIGAVYDGTVIRIVEFGAFVNFMPGIDGLVHISQIANERIENVSDYLKEGQQLKVRVLDVDNRGRIKLTLKDM
ncbi:MAG: polyribonucleotide nucleotidyltransferase [Pseudomonadota bacterium]